METQACGRCGRRRHRTRGPSSGSARRPSEQAASDPAAPPPQDVGVPHSPRKGDAQEGGSRKLRTARFTMEAALLF